jgi:hypothetical protein
LFSNLPIDDPAFGRIDHESSTLPIHERAFVGLAMVAALISTLLLGERERYDREKNQKRRKVFHRCKSTPAVCA